MLVLAGASVQGESLLETFGSGANQFSIQFVRINSPSNQADSGIDILSRPYQAGSVPYIYNLGKYEISREQILKANAEGGLGITLQDMTAYGGNINSRPASGIGWHEAARFVNWLNTNKGYQSAYKFDQNGNIQVWSAEEHSGGNQFRHKDAFFFLPSRDEWYKGAYFDPNKQSGGGYWKYSTGSDNPPTPVAVGTDSGTAIYGQPSASGPADINSAGGLSPFGTMGQGGNVWEWTDTPFDSTIGNFALRGGSWHDSDNIVLQASSHFAQSANFYDYGFRIASVPEPSSLSLLLAGGAVLMAGRRKNRIRGQD